MAAAKEYNLTLNEFNASDLRRKADLEPLIGLSNTSPMTGNSMRAILLDEADGLRNWKVVERLTTEPACPIILTCNDLSKIDYALRKRSLVFELAPPSIRHKRKLIDRICEGEGIKVPNKIKDKVAEVSRTYRSVIMTLQASVAVKSTAKIQERDVDASEYETIRRILMGEPANLKGVNNRKVLNYALANRVSHKVLTEADLMEHYALTTKGVNKITNSYIGCLRMPTDETFTRPVYRPKKNQAGNNGASRTKRPPMNKASKTIGVMNEPTKTTKSPKASTSFDGFFS